MRQYKKTISILITILTSVSFEIYALNDSKPNKTIKECDDELAQCLNRSTELGRKAKENGGKTYYAEWDGSCWEKFSFCKKTAIE